jgi:hypothetical protein
MHRHIHYEAAFEDYLRSRGIPYVPVDETRKAIFSGARIKSFDFLIYPPGDKPWIVDVKGRKFPYITETKAKRYWENWVTDEDLESLTEWSAVFKEEFEARFVFAYLLSGPPDRWPSVPPHGYLDDSYAFISVNLPDYAKHCRRRSGRWNTVSVPLARFREILGPIGENHHKETFRLIEG